jgi:hypothetical protein
VGFDFWQSRLLDGDVVLLIEVEPCKRDDRDEQGANSEIPHDFLLEPGFRRMKPDYGVFVPVSSP